tara:strand:+ start:2661 stop:4019 length:1359 start_codon:yes stop_codon:yes gene_type:complete
MPLNPMKSVQEFLYLVFDATIQALKTIVVGPVSEGSAHGTSAPVQLGGEDPAGDVARLQTDASKNLKIDIAASSGTVDTELEADDLDTGAGTDTQAIVGIGLAESGGHTLLGSANPMPGDVAQVGGTATDTNAGNKGAGTQRVTLADDDTNMAIIAGDTTSIDGKIPADPATDTKLDEVKSLLGEVQASPTANTVLDRLKDLLTGIILAAGSNTIGKLGANSGVDIGDVDVTSLPVGSQAMAAATPVTLATDDTQLGAVGAAADVDGNLHGQQRYIGEALDTLETTANAIQVAVELLSNAVGQKRTVSVSLTVDTDAYTVNDIVGGKLTLTSAARTSGGAGVILGVALVDMSMQDAEYDIIIFEQDPTNGTYTDDAAIDVDDTDADFLVGVITVSPGHYTDFTDNSVATVNNVNLPFTAVGSANLYAVAVTRGTPTYAAATDLQLRFKIAQD